MYLQTGYIRERYPVNASPDKETETVELIQTASLTLNHVAADVMQLSVAYLLALPIGWNREQEAHTAGIRTFPIIAVATCGLIMVSVGMPGSTPDINSRVLQGLVTGIGFVGGGAIFRAESRVVGVATAASVWSMGIVGASVGFGLYHIAVVVTLINFLTLKLLAPLRGVRDANTPSGK